MKIIPLYQNKSLVFYSADTSTVLQLSFAESGISAGFPSPADDFLELSIDLN